MAVNGQNVTMRDEVDQTIQALELDPEYAAAAALARVYADQLDSAKAAEKAADWTLTAAMRGDEDIELQELIQTLRSKLSARTTVANIGPRLAELLGRLLATPKDAGAVKPADASEGPRAATPGALARLRSVKSG